MILVFELSMPQRGSWNGGWSAERDYFAIVKSFKSQKAIRRAQEIMSQSPYHYSWSDGWGARVSVREIDAREAAGARRRSRGFCGYDWMVRTICDYGQILDDAQVRERFRKPLEDIAAQHSDDPVLANIEQGVRDGLAAVADK